MSTRDSEHLISYVRKQEHVLFNVPQQVKIQPQTDHSLIRPPFSKDLRHGKHCTIRWRNRKTNEVNLLIRKSQIADPIFLNSEFSKDYRVLGSDQHNDIPVNLWASQMLRLKKKVKSVIEEKIQANFLFC